MKVLLVAESERDVRRLQSVSAARGGGHFELTHVRSLADAMRELAGDRFDAVLLDLAERSDPVARVDALEPLVKLREGAPDVPIIVLTGVDDETIGVRALKAGAQDSLVKGMLDGHLLFRAIRYAIERHQLQMALRAMSLVDDLTGLYNRRGFLTLARQQLKIADRMRKRVSHIFVDLDGLKAINDSFGHREGDLALIETADLLKETFRESDIIARIGGDEFVVLAMENVGPNGGAEVWTTRLQENLLLRNARMDRRFPLSVSMGIAYYDPDFPINLEDLLDRADKTMYEQKRNKRLSPPLGVAARE
ncbi:MAG TPA: GGDEF domain-containing response regulator [Gemmatimonadaceae bacterium]|nr:GGDEF domain-containing response regulator [Gemmatimonadaceae bacterium]